MPISRKYNKPGSNQEFYNSKSWRKASAHQRAIEPLCRECKKKGKLTPAQMTDHIIPITQGGALFDIENLQSLCNRCHAVKRNEENREIYYNGPEKTNKNKKRVPCK